MAGAYFAVSPVSWLATLSATHLASRASAWMESASAVNASTGYNEQVDWRSRLEALSPARPIAMDLLMACRAREIAVNV